MRDTELQQAVLDELDFEPRVNAAHIGVTAKDGVVSIYGHVGSFVERMAAEAAVQRVRGVWAIANELDVNLPGDAVFPDDEIALRAARILDWDPVLTEEGFTIRVQRGQLELNGQTDSFFKKERATSVVAHLQGLRGIYNHIHVIPTASPDDLKVRIRNAILRQSLRDSNRIQIDVDKGRVTLTGQVDSLIEKELVATTAGSAPGVNKVENLLTVGD